jgi:outer membrane protein
MRSDYFYFITVILVVAGFAAKSQEKLTLGEAVQLALKNNYDILLSANDVEISKTNVSRGNAGMLPVVNGTLNTNSTISNTDQELSNGQSQSRTGVRNSNMNYGVSLNWRVFDGFGMFAAYDRLKEQQNLGETQFRLTVQNNIAAVINNYYTLVKQQQDVKASKTAVELSRFRVNNAHNRYQIGRAAKLEVLQATVDLNTDTTTLLRRRDLYRTTKVRLNELMARDLQTDFVVEDSIPLYNTLLLSELETLTNQQNPMLQGAVINQRIAALNLKEVKAYRYPQLTLNSGYNFTSSQNPLGFARSSSGQGFNYGLSASINIFNGFNQRRNEKIATIGINNSLLEYERLEQNVKAQLTSQYQTYITNLQLVKLESENVSVARQTLDITLEKLKYGTLTPLEFREAQSNYIESLARFIDAQYQAKISEVSLREIAGSISFD